MTGINRRLFLLGALGSGSAITGALIPVDTSAGEPRRNRSAEIDGLIARERTAIIDAMAKAGVEGTAV